MKKQEFECSSPPAGDVSWRCFLKDVGALAYHPPITVTARTAFAAGKIAEQVFDCHWSDLDIKLVVL